MGRTKKGGRPKAAETRSRYLNIRLTETELAWLRDKAAGAQLSDFARRRLLGKGEVRPIPEINQLAWEQLARTAANLNQLTHHANLGRFPHHEDFARALVRLSGNLKEVRERLIGGEHGDR
ncbi:plasmid mobilization protein [Donghicola tyrosinivorans]|uniref:Mobilization protein MobC n=1 Tax=Donghicola tyrosinivorans TaxID=1652492 RepID=A0A2T0WYF8_9RHOB|nr:plasmid mobilization relaxosome protein MobC [Donghicola tyrosinivorans]PRY91732.1 mobilization protein MobC [Donghicola tyrosinivorans]